MTSYERLEEELRDRMKKQIKSLDANTEIQCPHCGEQIRIKEAKQQEQDSVWQAPVISKDLTTPPI